eukprot:6794279-Pyramimonas_sp.AAC.1
MSGQQPMTTMTCSMGLPSGRTSASGGLLRLAQNLWPEPTRDPGEILKPVGRTNLQPQILQAGATS